jgi:hypothetical protein
MAKHRAICPVHGIVKEIEMACMWLGRPPIFEIDFAHCPKCGAKCRIEKDKYEGTAYWASNTSGRSE